MLLVRSMLRLACAVFLGASALFLGTSSVMAKRDKKPGANARFTPPTPTPQDFDVTLRRIGEASLDHGVMLELSAYNHASGPRTFCQYYTPFEGFLNDILEVLDDKGKSVAYPGPLADRPPPGPSSYVSLRAGETRSVRFDLAQHYSLHEGSFRVRSGEGIGTLPRSAQLSVVVAAKGPAQPAPSEAPLVVLAAEPDASSSRGVFVSLTVRNHGTKPLRFCEYHTPFEGMRNDFIGIVDAAGRPVPYAGMMAKRAAPTEEDYFTVEPGHARTQRFELGEGYKLAPGAYRAHFLGGAVSGLPASEAVALTVGP